MKPFIPQSFNGHLLLISCCTWRWGTAVNTDKILAFPVSRETLMAEEEYRKAVVGELSQVTRTREQKTMQDIERTLA